VLVGVATFGSFQQQVNIEGSEVCNARQSAFGKYWHLACSSLLVLIPLMIGPQVIFDPRQA
jgi:hypothetical protein